MCYHIIVVWKWCALDTLYTLHMHQEYCNTNNTYSLWIKEFMSTGANGLPYALLLKLLFLVQVTEDTGGVINIPLINTFILPNILNVKTPWALAMGIWIDINSWCV